MTGVITTGNHPKALWPGMHAFFGRTYKEQPDFIPKMFNIETSDKSYEEDTEVTGFGLAPEKSQGASTSYDSESQSWTKRYTHVAYALGYIVTREERDDNKYEIVSKRRIKGLAFSMAETKQIVAHNIFNRAFNSSYVGGDSKELLATDHETLDGTQSNELATAADLSEASLEDLCIQIMQAKNSRGLRISIMPEALIVPVNLAFEAERILKSTLRAGTSDNDTNAIRNMGLFPKGIVASPYLTDTDAFFVKTNCPNGMTFFRRTSIEFAQDNDFDTKNAKAAAYERYAVGWTDWRGMYGSPGA